MNEIPVPVVDEKIDRLRKDFDTHEQDQCAENVRIWKAIDELRNRLPNWAVFLIATLTAALGWFASYLR